MKSKPASRAMGTPTTRRVAIYTRKSTSAGLEMDFSSLDAQRDACAAYVGSQPGWVLVPERYDDGGFTGANLDRPAFQRLLADVDARRIDVVVVYKVDRLSRSLLDFAKVIERFDAGGCAFVSVTQNFSTADAMGRLTLNLLISFAEFEREMIADRTRDKIAGARRRGKWTGGRAPLGYQLEGGKLVVDPLEAIVVHEIYDAYLARRSIVGVIELMRERGRTTKRHVSAAGRVLAARAWTKDAVLRILRNVVYAGFVDAGGELVAGQHEAIVARDQWDAVQRTLGSRTTGPRAASEARYLLAGLVRCAACGCGMTQASTKTRGREYRYHRCGTRDRRGADACPTQPIAADELERIVIERIRVAAADRSLPAAVLARARELARVQRARIVAERDALPPVIAKLGADARRQAEAFAEARGAARAQVDALLEETTRQVRAHEARLEVLDAELRALDELELEARWVASTIGNFAALWDAMAPPTRARLVRALVERVVVDEAAGKIRVELRDGAGGARAEVAA